MTDERWGTYPCRVDDAPASILVAMHHEGRPLPPAAETLHVVGLEMLDAGEHGTGTEAEARALRPVEDALGARLGPSGFVQVGRLRNLGHWQLSYYGPARRTDEFLAVAEQAARDAGRPHWTHVDLDAEWSYYTSFLLPDPERRKWMADAAVVRRLEEHGDALSTPRPVDHDLEFPSVEAAALFLEAAGLRGHARVNVAEEPDDRGLHAVRVRRTDPVDIDHIHAVVMDLAELAAPYDGDHVGWGCGVELPA